MTAVGVYLNLITEQSARINRGTCSPPRCGGRGKGEGEGGEEDGVGMNLISTMGGHIRVCGNEYADGRVAELSDQICALVTAETQGKCASRDSATTARFMRITLFDVQKFRASA